MVWAFNKMCIGLEKCAWICKSMGVAFLHGLVLIMNGFVLVLYEFVLVLN